MVDEPSKFLVFQYKQSTREAVQLLRPVTGLHHSSARGHGLFPTMSHLCMSSVLMSEANVSLATRAPTSFLKATQSSFHVVSELLKQMLCPAYIVHIWGHGLQSVPKCVPLYMERFRMQVSLFIQIKINGCEISPTVRYKC